MVEPSLKSDTSSVEPSRLTATLDDFKPAVAMTRLCSPRKPSARRTSACRHDTDTHARVTCSAAGDSDNSATGTHRSGITARRCDRGGGRCRRGLPRMHASPAATDVSRHDATTAAVHDSPSQPPRHQRLPSPVLPVVERGGEVTAQTETSHAASSSPTAATAHTHRSRCSAGRSRRGRSRRSGTCLRHQQHVSHATRDHAGQAATNGPQRPLTAAGPAVGAAAGAAACITHHSDARTVTAAHTTGQHTHADSDVTSVALTAAAPPAPADGTAGEAAA
jgi:hypothetical protein